MENSKFTSRNTHIHPLSNITFITILLALILFNGVNNKSLAQAPTIEWQKCLGGTNDDRAYSIQQTSDGGFIVASITGSNDGDVSGNHGYDDAWVVKLNSSGNIEWQKCLGGTSYDVANSIQQTSDGGFIVSGYTGSNDGDVSGKYGATDYWIVKLNSSGDIEWQKCLGGIYDDFAYSIQQTNDGGFIVAGFKESNESDMSGNHGAIDALVVKLNSSGDIEWQKCLGGTDYDSAHSIQQISDGGFIVAGRTRSNNGDVSGNHGACDAWVVKLNSSGDIEWQKCLGGTDNDYANSIQQTSDGGFIVAGGTHSNDGDVSGNHGRDDAWVVKLNSTGDIEWQKCLGGTDNDFANSIQQSNDGGFIVAGFKESNESDMSGNHGAIDALVVKLNSSGDIEWQKCLGGTDYDSAHSIQQISDGGFIVAGRTRSNNGDVSGNHGACDAWVVKLNSSGDIEWQKCLGGTDNDYANSIQQSSDGGFIVAGETKSNDGDVSGNHGVYDYWVVKLNSSGDIEWQKCLGGTDYDYAYSIHQTSDGGFIVAGNTASNDGDVSGNHGASDAWVVKLNK